MYKDIKMKKEIMCITIKEAEEKMEEYRREHAVIVPNFYRKHLKSYQTMSFNEYKERYYGYQR